MPSCENMQCRRTAPYTTLVTSETTHRLQAGRFDLQGEAEWKSVVSGIDLSLVTMHHLVQWDRRTNSCLAILTRLSSWQTKHFLLVLQRSGMTCLLTAVLQLVWIVLNVTLNAYFFFQRVCWSLLVKQSPLTLLIKVTWLGIIGAL